VERVVRNALASGAVGSPRDLRLTCSICHRLEDKTIAFAVPVDIPIPEFSLALHIRAVAAAANYGNKTKI